MCKCNPQIRTPFCGAPGCEWPNNFTIQTNETPVIEMIYITQKEYDELKEKAAKYDDLCE